MIERTLRQCCRSVLLPMCLATEVSVKQCLDYFSITWKPFSSGAYSRHKFYSQHSLVHGPIAAWKLLKPLENSAWLIDWTPLILHAETAASCSCHSTIICMTSTCSIDRLWFYMVSCRHCECLNVCQWMFLPHSLLGIRETKSRRTCIESVQCWKPWMRAVHGASFIRFGKLNLWRPSFAFLCVDCHVQPRRR